MPREPTRAFWCAKCNKKNFNIIKSDWKSDRERHKAINLWQFCNTFLCVMHFNYFHVAFTAPFIDLLLPRFFDERTSCTSSSFLLLIYFLMVLLFFKGVNHNIIMRCGTRTFCRLQISFVCKILLLKKSSSLSENVVHEHKKESPFDHITIWF